MAGQRVGDGLPSRACSGEEHISDLKFQISRKIRVGESGVFVMGVAGYRRLWLETFDGCTGWGAKEPSSQAVARNILTVALDGALKYLLRRLWLNHFMVTLDVE